jgi:chemotaxis protein histidine kinase CheA
MRHAPLQAILRLACKASNPRHHIGSRSGWDKEATNSASKSNRPLSSPRSNLAMAEADTTGRRLRTLTGLLERLGDVTNEALEHQLTSALNVARRSSTVHAVHIARAQEVLEAAAEARTGANAARERAAAEARAVKASWDQAKAKEVQDAREAILKAAAGSTDEKLKKAAVDMQEREIIDARLAIKRAAVQARSEADEMRWAVVKLKEEAAKKLGEVVAAQRAWEEARRHTIQRAEEARRLEAEERAREVAEAAAFMQEAKRRAADRRARVEAETAAAAEAAAKACRQAEERARREMAMGMMLLEDSPYANFLRRQQSRMFALQSASGSEPGGGGSAPMAMGKLPSIEKLLRPASRQPALALEKLVELERGLLLRQGSLEGSTSAAAVPSRVPTRGRGMPSRGAMLPDSESTHLSQLSKTVSPRESPAPALFVSASAPGPLRQSTRQSTDTKVRSSGRVTARLLGGWRRRVVVT